MLQKIKDYVYEKRYYFLGGLTIAGILFLYNRQEDPTYTITSDFIALAKSNFITRAIVDGDTVFFRVVGN